jgi:hypothetical protein
MDKKEQKIAQKIKGWSTRTPLKSGVNSGIPEELAVPVPIVTPFVLQLNDTNIIWYENQLNQLFEDTILISMYNCC